MSDYKIEDGRRLSGPALVELMRAVFMRKTPFRFRSSGNSMDPFIKDGDVLTLAPIGQNSVGLGDVVGFIHPHSKRLAIHRVVARSRFGCWVKGDNLPIADGFIPTEELFGRLVRIERKGRMVILGRGPERYLIALFSRWVIWTKARRCLSTLRGRWTPTVKDASD